MVPIVVIGMNETGSGEDLSAAAEQADNDPLPDCTNFSVAIANEQQLLAIDEQLLVRAVEDVLADSTVRTAEISIAVVDDPTIHRLNVEFLEHDYPTDVLSFALEESETHLEGELIVSTDTASREAAEAGWAPHDELLLYVIHGTLHLVGYLDAEADERREMLAAELTHLKRLGIQLPADVSRWAEVADSDLLGRG